MIKIIVIKIKIELFVDTMRGQTYNYFDNDYQLKLDKINLL